MGFTYECRTFTISVSYTHLISLHSRNLNKALSFYHTAIMNSSVTWCVASVPTVLWADLLGYEGTDEEKIDQLWATLLKLCRIEGIEAKDTYLSLIHIYR